RRRTRGSPPRPARTPLITPRGPPPEGPPRPPPPPGPRPAAPPSPPPPPAPHASPHRRSPVHGALAVKPRPRVLAGLVALALATALPVTAGADDTTVA